MPLAGFKFPMQKLLIGVGVLVSYQHMGYGQVACLQGCFCQVCPSPFLNQAGGIRVQLDMCLQPREVNLHHNFHFSLTYFKPFIVEVRALLIYISLAFMPLSTFSSNSSEEAVLIMIVKNF